MTARTTLSADEDDLETLRAEARRRGISLATLLREVVAREAANLRAQRRPRFGIGRSGVGAARIASEREDEPFESLRGG
ncbi:MAG: ribbon-helix-helix protein, CopG family [Actinomycetota bacterium]|nr:ribbon-helix-helix protein, CopG family [Actinomycetota bacterium]